MIITVTARGESPNSSVDGRFTLARYFLAYDVTDGRWEAVKFSLWSQQQKFSGQIRAGVLAEKKVGALITGGVDPTAFKELAKRGIRVYLAPDCLVREAADMLVRGLLQVLQVPDAVNVARLIKKGTTIKY